MKRPRDRETKRLREAGTQQVSRGAQLVHSQTNLGKTTNVQNEEKNQDDQILDIKNLGFFFINQVMKSGLYNLQSVQFFLNKLGTGMGRVQSHPYPNPPHTLTRLV